MSEPRAGREMTSAELVETFECEAGERWFRDSPGGGRVTHVSPPHPGIVPTWPRLIRERAIEEAAALSGDSRANGEPGPGGLDAAWAEAEAVLPEAWELTVSSSKFRAGWVAYANEYQLGRAPGKPYIPLIESEPFPGSHPTPVAALRSLTSLLESDSRLRALREADPS